VKLLAMMPVDSGRLPGPLQTARPTPVYALQQLHLQRLLSRSKTDEFIILAGDFNLLDCSQLENQYGLVQLVNQPTHGDNILDKVFTNRPDCFVASVGRNLLKTKHLAVIVNCDQSAKPVSYNRVKVKLYDLRCHNIDRLRYMTATHD